MIIQQAFLKRIWIYQIDILKPLSRQQTDNETSIQTRLTTQSADLLNSTKVIIYNSLGVRVDTHSLDYGVCTDFFFLELLILT